MRTASTFVAHALDVMGVAKVTPSAIISATICWRHRRESRCCREALGRISMSVRDARCDGRVVEQHGDGIEHRPRRRTDAPFLIVALNTSKRVPSSATSSLGSVVGKRGEYLFISGERVFNTARSKRHHGRSHDAVARPHAAEIEGLLDVLGVAGPVTDAGRLLARVGERMSHLALIETQHRGCGGGGGERRITGNFPAPLSDMTSRAPTS